MEKGCFSSTLALCQGQEFLDDSTRYCFTCLKIISENSTLPISSPLKSTVLPTFSNLWFQLSFFQIQLTSSSCFLRRHGKQLIVYNNLWYIGSLLSCSLFLPFYFCFLLVGRDFNMSVQIFVLLLSCHLCRQDNSEFQSCLLNISDSHSFTWSTFLTSRKCHLLMM